MSESVNLRLRALALALLLVACSSGSSSPSLRIDLVTDFAPGVEAARAEVRLNGGPPQERSLATVPGDQLRSGYPIADFPNLAVGTHEVIVTLHDETGTQRGRRRTLVEVRRRTVVPVLIGRECETISCPPEDDPSRTECFGSGCVAPECSASAPEACDPIEECTADDDCTAPIAACARARCSEVTGVRVCLDVPIRGVCGDGEVCVPDEGCRPVGAPDAGLLGDGGIDADVPDAADAGTADASTGCVEGSPCEPEDDCALDGRLRCDGPVPVCEPSTPQPLGATCRAPSGECDVEEVCDGVSFGCPEDAFALIGQSCTLEGGGSGFCDGAGSCSGDCTPGERCDAGPCALGRISCTGGVPACIPDTPKASGTECRPADPASPCDAPELCDGTSLECPEDRPRAFGETCRPSVGECDVPERCDGSRFGCPSDAFAPTGTECTVAGGGLGACVDGSCTDECVPGAPCGTDDRCATRQIDCTTGSPRCVVVELAPDDTRCDDESYGAWGTCQGFTSTCDLDGTQYRAVTRYRCSSGTCQAQPGGLVSQPCSRSTDGEQCGDETEGPWGTCGGFDDMCDEIGERTRTITAFACAGGSCVAMPRPDVEACSRDTDGDSCAMDVYGSWTGCTGFADDCDEEGSRSRSVTGYECVAGGCSAMARPDQTEECTRDTDGDSCGEQDLGPCTGSGCSTTGSQSVANYACSAGTCQSSVTSQSCTRVTECIPCGPGAYCISGVCETTLDCR